jgi:hypothetical protein
MLKLKTEGHIAVSLLIILLYVCLESEVVKTLIHRTNLIPLELIRKKKSKKKFNSSFIDLCGTEKKTLEITVPEIFSYNVSSYSLAFSLTEWLTSSTSNYLPLTAFGSNLVRDLGLFHVTELPARLLNVISTQVPARA